MLTTAPHCRVSSDNSRFARSIWLESHTLPRHLVFYVFLTICPCALNTFPGFDYNSGEGLHNPAKTFLKIIVFEKASKMA